MQYSYSVYSPLFYREALLFEKAFEDLKERQRSPQYQAPKVVYEAIDEEGLALFGKHITHERETLHVGDYVSFFSEVRVHKLVHSTILSLAHFSSHLTPLSCT